MALVSSRSVIQILEKAIQARMELFDGEHHSAFRLFNGFSEGYPNLTLEVYGSTLIIHDYSDDPIASQAVMQGVVKQIFEVFRWLRAGIWKARSAKTHQERRGTLILGQEPDNKVKEHGIWYAIDLTMNRDTSFYLDTRLLRKWLIDTMSGKSVLNTFAYTGSLGVAALSGGAVRVVQHDLHRRFLNVARTSCELNGFRVHEQDIIAADFFPTVARLKSTRQFFDCVILDPPFFSTTSKGTVNQEKESARLINKVRPLINDGGYLVAINNALYVSGREYLGMLERLCQDGYLKIEKLIPVPQDCTGYNIVSQPITDPSPFNHSTKIAILRVRRKEL